MAINHPVSGFVLLLTMPRGMKQRWSWQPLGVATAPACRELESYTIQGSIGNYM